MAPKKRLIPPPNGAPLPSQPLPATCAPGFFNACAVHILDCEFLTRTAEAVGSCTFAMGPIEWDSLKEVFRSRPVFTHYFLVKASA